MLSKIYESIKGGADFAEVVVHNKNKRIVAYVLAYYGGKFLTYTYDTNLFLANVVSDQIIHYLKYEYYDFPPEENLRQYISICQHCCGAYYGNQSSVCRFCRDKYLNDARNDVYFFSNDCNSFEGGNPISNDGWTKSSYVVLGVYYIRKITVWTHPDGGIDDIVDEIKEAPLKWIRPNGIELIMPKFLQFAADHLCHELCLIASLDLVADIRRQIAMLYVLSRLY